MMENVSEHPRRYFWETDRSPTVGLTVWTVSLLILGILAGSVFAKIEIIARGQGKIVPIAKVQFLQPQKSGKISNILIQEGDLVAAGQVLIELDQTSATSEITSINADLQRLESERLLCRGVLSAFEANDPSNVKFAEIQIETLLQNQLSGQKLKEVRNQLNATLLNIRDTITQTDSNIEKAKKTIEVGKAKITLSKLEYEYEQKKYVNYKELLAKGSVSQANFQDRERAMLNARNQIDILIAQQNEIEAEYTSFEKQRQKEISTQRLQYKVRLNDAETTLNAQRGKRKAALRDLADATLVAPIGGKIENLAVFTIGGFVEAGSKLLSIVPVNSGLEIEAFFPNKDVGFLTEGQLVYVKLDAFPAERFGFVRGRVRNVGADARDPKGNNEWLYAVRIALDRDHLESQGKKLVFSSGMTGTVDVVTGHRTLFSYFFEPIIKNLQDSFGER